MEVNRSEFQEMLRSLYGPAWRWELARRGAAGDLTGPLLDSDTLVKETADYLELLAQGDGEAFVAARHHPRVHAAVVLWNNPLLQGRLKTVMVGGCSPVEVSARLGLDDGTVTTTMALFFDVAGRLQARGWVIASVIIPEEQSGNTDLAVQGVC